MAGRVEQQRVAVGSSARDHGRPDVAARPAPVLDDHSLAPALAELFPQDAPKRVSRSSRRKRDHQPNGLVRVGLSNRRLQTRENQERAQQGMRKRTEQPRVHLFLPQSRVRPAVILDGSHLVQGAWLAKQLFAGVLELVADSGELVFGRHPFGDGNRKPQELRSVRILGCHSSIFITARPGVGHGRDGHQAEYSCTHQRFHGYPPW